MNIFKYPSICHTLTSILYITPKIFSAVRKIDPLVLYFLLLKLKLTISTDSITMDQMFRMKYNSGKQHLQKIKY